MFTEEQVIAGENLASSLYFAEKKVIPLSNSPLNQLVNTLEGLTDSTSNANIMAMGNSLAGSNLHGDKETYIVEQVSMILGNILNTAKNIVRPLALKIIEEVGTKRTNRLLDKQNILNNVVYLSLPEILEDDRFLSLIEDFNSNNSIPFKIPELFNAIGSLSSEEMTILMQTGSPTLDKKIADVKMQCCMSEGVSDPSALSISELIGYFLIFNGFINGRLDSLTSLLENLSVKTAALEARNTVAGQLSRIVTKYNNAIKRGEIITPNIFSSESSSKTCYVFSETYKKWLQEEGGSIEALLGFASVTTNSVTFYNSSELRDNVEKYTLVYEKKRAVLENVNLLEDVTDVKNCVMDEVASYIGSLENVDKTMLYAKLKEFTDHDYYGGDHLMEFVIKVICRVFDWHDIKVFLLEAENLFKSDDNITIERAVYLATVKLIGHWTGQQMQVIKTTQ
jgi:hypothetical protein